MERIKRASFASNNADLVASWVDSQRKAGQGNNKTNPEILAAPAPAEQSERPKSFRNKTADSSPAFSKRIALFDKQENPDATSSCNIVIVRVGTGDDERAFRIDANALCASSRYFRKCLSRSQEVPVPEEITRPNVEPSVFEMFVDWCSKPRKPLHYKPGRYSEEPWISEAVSAWMLAHRFTAPKFEIYALSQFIQNCAIVLKGPWKFIEDNVPPESSLSRFSNHWIAWNTFLSGNGVNEYTGLSAAKYASQVTTSTRDPRTLDLQHWYSDCGNDINAKCEHDPVFREEQERRAKVLRDKPPPLEWGAEAEARASQGAYSSSS